MAADMVAVITMAADMVVVITIVADTITAVIMVTAMAIGPAMATGPAMAMAMGGDRGVTTVVTTLTTIHLTIRPPTHPTTLTPPQSESHQHRRLTLRGTKERQYQIPEWSPGQHPASRVSGTTAPAKRLITLM